MKYARTACLSLVAAALALSSASSSKADPSTKTNLVSLVDQGQQWLRAATAGPTVSSDPTSHHTEQPTASRPTELEPSAEAPKPFLELLPSASLVARDWRGSMRLVGKRSTLLDDLRPDASNRMVMGRLATDGSTLSLFAQAGVGQWRVDTVMFPNAVSDSELAGQLGGGFELRLSSRVRLAAECDYTMLYRDLHYGVGEVQPRMTSYLVAFAGTF